MLVISKARAVSNHEGGPVRTHLILFETHRTVGKCRLCDAPQDEVETATCRGWSARPSEVKKLTRQTHRAGK
jgi:hypothetical protein